MTDQTIQPQPVVAVVQFSSPENTLKWKGDNLAADDAPLAFVAMIREWLATSPAVGGRITLNPWHYAERVE